MLGQKRTTDLDIAIGQRIKEARTLTRVSQSELAKALGVSFQQVQKYENGANRICARRLYEIANLLGYSIAWFYNGDPNEDSIPTPGKELADKIASLPYPEQRRSIELIVDVMLGHAPALAAAVE